MDIKEERDYSMIFFGLGFLDFPDNQPHLGQPYVSCHEFIFDFTEACTSLARLHS
jgi:hypothetical protein